MLWKGTSEDGNRVCGKRKSLTIAIVNLRINNTGRKVFLHLLFLHLLLLTDYFDSYPVLPLHLVVDQTKILSVILNSHRGEVKSNLSNVANSLVNLLSHLSWFSRHWGIRSLWLVKPLSCNGLDQGFIFSL